MKHYLLYTLVVLFLLAAPTTPCSAKRRKAAPNPAMLTAVDQRRFDTCLLAAISCKERDELDTAFELLNHCYQINPRSAVVVYELALLNYALNNTPHTAELLAQAVAMAPDNYWYHETLASLCHMKGMYEEALKTYETIEQRFPKRGEVLDILAELYTKMNDYDKIIDVYERIEKRDGISYETTIHKALSYAYKEQFDRAIAEFDALMAAYPHDPIYKVLLGHFYLIYDRYEEALPIACDVLKDDSENPDAQFLLASYYQATEQDSLYRVQNEALLLNSRYNTEKRLSIMQQMMREYRIAQRDDTPLLQLFDQIIATETDDTQLSELYAAYLVSGDGEVDKEHVERVIHHILSITPDNFAAHHELVQYALADENWQAVIDLCTTAIAYIPDEMFFYFYKGAALKKLEQTDAALAVFLKGLDQLNDESDPNTVSLFYELCGDLYHEQEQKERSYEMYEKALTYNPENIGALNNYAYFLSLDKVQLDKAEEMSYRTVQAEPQNATYLDTYAWILFEKGCYAEAKLYIDSAMKMGYDESAVIVEHCGDIYYMCGEVEDAVRFWQQAAAMEHESTTLEEKIRLRKYIEPK